jgi:hypothetical protein
MPVLTEETVCGTACVEYGQVVATSMFATFANPVGHAVGRQRIAIPVEKTACGCPGEMNKLAIARCPESTEAALVFANHALVAAQHTTDAGGMARRFGWQIKRSTGGGVGVAHLLAASGGGSA